jgi:HK97 gp10 family phage protein
MAAVTMKVEGLDAAIRRVTDLGEHGKAEVSKAIRASALKIQADVVDSITRGGKTGRVYQRGEKTHTASAPGEAPASDSGDLARNIVIRTQGREGEVTAKIRHAYWMEFGTQDIEPRPFMRPALDANRDYIFEQIERAMQRATARVGGGQ